MALTLTERAEVRMWLGYPDPARFPVTWGVAVLSSLETTLDRLSPETEALVVKQLDRLRALDDAVFGTGSGAGGSVQQAGIKQLGQGEIEWFPGGGAWTSQEAAKERLIVRLAALLGVPRLDEAGCAAPIPLA